MESEIFAKLADTNVNEHIEEKATGATKLKYLSWAWAWDYFKRRCPDAKYEIRHWDDKPYLFDEKTGYMVETSVTVGGETHTMWLPVMDSANRAMKDAPYTVKTKYNEFTVPAATMFDINKTIMRCLVKNIAMFGLGLYIYAGEDLPSDTEETVVEEKPVEKPSIDKVIAGMEQMTLDSVKRFYAKAIDLYGKETPEYTLWLPAWVRKKEQLESESVKQDLKSELDALESFYG